MKEMIYAGKHKFEWREGRDPRIQGDRQAIVRPIAATACDFDRRILSGLTPFEPPFAIGHEAVGEVVEVGGSVKLFKRGDIVVIPWGIYCGECEMCNAGLSGQCCSYAPNATYGVPIGGHFGGLFSDQVLVPFADAMLVPVPSGVDPIAAAGVSDNLTDAWINLTKGLTKHPGGRVVIHGGTGALGVYAVDMAFAAGAESVEYVDEHPVRRALAEKWGAIVHERLPEDYISRFHVVVSATRDVAQVRGTILAARPGGHVSGLAIHTQDIMFPVWDMYLRDLSYSSGRPSIAPHIPRVLTMLKCGHIHPHEAVSQIIPWDDAPQALLDMPPMKPVVFRSPLYSNPVPFATDYAVFSSQDA